MGSFSVSHWLIVLLIVMFVFGTKKIGNMGSDLGKAIKGFKDGVRVDEDKPHTAATPASQVADKATIDLQAGEKDQTGG